MAGMIWVSDREPGVRLLLGEVVPEAEVLDPVELESRLALGQRPDALIIDGTQLIELPARLRRAAVALPRVLICTGLMLASMPMNLIAGPGVAVLAKPFCVEDLEAAAEWVRGTPSSLAGDAALLARAPGARRPRRRRSSLPTA